MVQLIAVSDGLMSCKRLSRGRPALAGAGWTDWHDGTEEISPTSLRQIAVQTGKGAAWHVKEPETVAQRLGVPALAAREQAAGGPQGRKSGRGTVARTAYCTLDSPPHLAFPLCPAPSSPLPFHDSKTAPRSDARPRQPPATPLINRTLVRVPLPASIPSHP